MAKEFQRGDGHALPQSKSGGLCNDDLREQLDDCSYVLDALGDYESGLFSPNFPLSSNETGVEGPVLGADKNGELWPPPDVPSPMPSSLIDSTLSNTYETRDFDPIDPSVLGPSSVMLNDEDTARRCWSLLGPSFPHLASEPNRSPAHVTVCQAQVVADSHNPTVIQKRKRSDDRLTNHKDSETRVDGRSALMFIFRKTPKPTVEDIEEIAEGLGLSCDFVIKVYRQHRTDINSDAPHVNDVVTIDDLSTSSAVPTTVIVEHGIRTEDLAVTSLPSKRPRPNTEVSQAADKDSRKKPYPCPKCDGGVTREADLPRHLRTHVPGQFHCHYPECNMVFSRKDKLNEHWRRRHEDGTSRSDIAQRRRDDPEHDPDFDGPSGADRSNRGGGYLQGGKPLQSSQKGARSITSRCSAQESSSAGSLCDPATNFEVFYPVSQNKPAVEHLRKFAAAQVIGKLGQGGFGQVHEISVNNGTDAKDPEAFARKKIRLPNHSRDEVVERARNEISILQVLNHPNIIEFAGAFILPRDIFIYTRPVADCNLKEFLNRQSSLLPSLLKCQVWEGVRGFASAVAYLHGHGRGGGFHGDIKPENILVMEDQEVKSGVRFLLADFGSARLSTSTSTSRVIQSNQALTPRYCAPEWFKNGERGPPSDIWSFGCILTQIVTHLHDKTMADFETFRVYSDEVKRDWNYHESLPVVKDWLGFLFHNRSKVTHTPTGLEHMDLILHMLSSNPRERPSAADVVTKLEVYNNMATQKADQARNAMMELVQQPQEIFQHTASTTNCGSERPGMETLGIWPDESTG